MIDQMMPKVIFRAAAGFALVLFIAFGAILLAASESPQERVSNGMISQMWE